MQNFWKKLKKPFTVLAPMDDVTDNVFRRVINETARPDVFFTEFTNTDGIVHSGGEVVKRKLKFEARQNPIVAQIWGNNPDSFYKSSIIIKEMGFDGIDINMGCPIREVMKRKAGSGLIGEYELAGQIIDATKIGAKGIPVSVKTRLGKGKNIAEEWLSFLLKQNIATLTLHARTAAQMSKVPADWTEIGKLVELRNKISPDTLIVGNGDIKSYEQVLNMHKKYNVDGVMIGRGIFENPWVFEPLNPVNPTLSVGAHSTIEYIDLLLKHFDYFEKENPDPKVVKKRYPSLKKFFKMYITSFKGANVLRQRLMETTTIGEAREIIQGLNHVNRV